MPEVLLPSAGGSSSVEQELNETLHPQSSLSKTFLC